MSEHKELADLPIWQNHEQRITALEVTTSNIKSEFKEVKEKIDRGNDEQSKKLEIIDKRLMDEFFKKKNTMRENYWKLLFKVVGAILGGGSFLYILIKEVIM